MFSWDVKKALINFEKHGVPFEEAATVFVDPEGLDWEDKSHSHLENRHKKLGRSSLKRILLVVYTLRRLKNGKETIRLISSRQASRKERKTYAG